MEVYDGDEGQSLSSSVCPVAPPGACNHLRGLFPSHGLGKGTWCDLDLSPVLAATRSRWLWHWLCSPASPSLSCSSCSTSAGAAPSLALTVSSPSLVTQYSGCDTGGQPCPHISGAAGAVGHLGWVAGVARGTVGGGTPVEGCWLPRESGQQLLIHSWNGFSL